MQVQSENLLWHRCLQTRANTSAIVRTIAAWLTDIESILALSAVELEGQTGLGGMRPAPSHNSFCQEPRMKPSLALAF